MHAIVRRHLKEAALGKFRFAPMSSDRVFDRGGAAVMQEGPPEPQSPEGRRPNLFRVRRSLGNPIAGTNVMQQQIGEQGHWLSIKQRMGAGSGLQRGHMTGGTADGPKDALTV